MALDTVNGLISLEDAKLILGQTRSVAQIVDVTCEADTAGSLDADSFIISSIGVDYYAWFDVDDGSVDPATAGRTGIEVDISANDSAVTVATALAAKIAALDAFGAVRTGNTIRITNAEAGPVTAAADTDTGWTIEEKVAGSLTYPNYEEVLTDLINQASWFLNGETRRELKTRTQTEYYDGPGGNELYLNQKPITGVTLYQDSDRTYAADTEIASTDFIIYEDEGKLYLTGTTFLNDRLTVKVVYTGGYVVIPHDLQRACRELVAQGFELLEHHAYSGERSNDAGVTDYRLDELPNVTAAIKRYREVVAI